MIFETDPALVLPVCVKPHNSSAGTGSVYSSGNADVCENGVTNKLLNVSKDIYLAMDNLKFIY